MSIVVHVSGTMRGYHHAPWCTICCHMSGSIRKQTGIVLEQNMCWLCLDQWEHSVKNSKNNTLTQDSEIDRTSWLSVWRWKFIHMIVDYITAFILWMDIENHEWTPELSRIGHCNTIHRPNEVCESGQCQKRQQPRQSLEHQCISMTWHFHNLSLYNAGLPPPRKEWQQQVKSEVLIRTTQ